jgi:hypothetical protein
MVLLLLMVLGSLVLWVGIPFGWLWVAGQMQAATGNLGVALAVAMIGVVLSIALVIPLLVRLNEAYRARRIARGLDDTGNLALEGVLVTSAGIALVGFTIWFLLFAGTSPIPLNLSP